MKSEDQFLPWLQAAAAGDKHVYYVGTSASRAPRVQCDGVLGATPLAGLAKLAMEARLVLLFQRRIASHKFEYIAMRTHVPYARLPLPYDPEPAIA